MKKTLILILFVLLKGGTSSNGAEGQKKAETDNRLISKILNLELLRAVLRDDKVENKTNLNSILKEMSHKLGQSRLISDQEGIPLEATKLKGPSKPVYPYQVVTKIIDRKEKGKGPIFIFEANQMDSTSQTHTGSPHNAKESSNNSYLPRFEGSLNTHVPKKNREIFHQITLPELSSYLSNDYSLGSNPLHQFSVNRKESDNLSNDYSNVTGGTSLFLRFINKKADELLDEIDNDYFDRVVREEPIPEGINTRNLSPRIRDNSYTNKDADTGIPLPGLPRIETQNPPNSHSLPTLNFEYNVSLGSFPDQTQTLSHDRPVGDSGRKDHTATKLADSQSFSGNVPDYLNNNNGRHIHDLSTSTVHLQEPHQKAKTQHHDGSYTYRYELRTHGHKEQRRGQRTEGRYYVDLPNGLRQIVSYYADETGYHPTITYEPIPRHYTHMIVSGPPSNTKENVTVNNPPPSINFPTFDYFPNTKGKYFGITTTSSRPSLSVQPTTTPKDRPTTTPESIGKEMGTTKPKPIIDPEFIRKSSKPTDSDSSAFQIKHDDVQ